MANRLMGMGGIACMRHLAMMRGAGGAMMMTTRSLVRRAFSSGPEESSTHVLFMSGPDRAGVVSKLAATVSEMGGNMEASRSTLLGDQFSLIALMSIPKSSMPGLSSALQERMKEYVVYTRPAGRIKAEDAKKQSAGITHYELLLEGPDSVGIISAVTEVLARCSVSILDMKTDLTMAPFAGFPLFILKARFGATKQALAKVESFMEPVESAFGVTVTIDEVEN